MLFAVANEQGITDLKQAGQLRIQGEKTTDYQNSCPGKSKKGIQGCFLMLRIRHIKVHNPYRRLCGVLDAVNVRGRWPQRSGHSSDNQRFHSVQNCPQRDFHP